MIFATKLRMKLLSVAVLSTLLSACAATTEGSDPEQSAESSQSEQSPSAVETRAESQYSFSPQGPAGAWLHPGYIDGIADTWETTESSCGVSDDSRFIMLQGANEDRPEVSAVDLRTGEKLWTRTPARCEESSVLGTTGLITGAEEVGDGSLTFSLVRVDISNGQPLTQIPMAQDLATLRLVGEAEGIAYAQAYSTGTDTKLMAIGSDGQLAWETILPSEVARNRCSLLGEAIGCSAFVGPFWVADRKTGEELVPATETSEDFIWAYDGYVYYDPLEQSSLLHRFPPDAFEVNADSAPPQIPSGESRVFFPLQDLESNPGIVAVSQEGIPVVTASGMFGDTFSFTQTGVAIDDADMSVAWDGVAADGSFVAYRTSPMGDEIIVRATDGTQVASLAAELDFENQSGIFTDVQGGLFVSLVDDKTVVHLPTGF